MGTGPPKIGIAGGVGPHAGVHLARLVLQETVAERDQDYPSVVLLSTPAEIEDRTRFLLGQTRVNPAHALAANVLDLEAAGASVVGIPCNSAHAPEIWSVLTEELRKASTAVELLDMIAETTRHLREHHASVRTVGVLSTLGTWRSGFYPSRLAEDGYDAVVLDEHQQREIHEGAIYHPEQGIKARANPVTAEARQILLAGVEALRARGAELVLLGCTEIPLGLPEARVGGTPLLDPARVLARALVRKIEPQKLRAVQP